LFRIEGKWGRIRRAERTKNEVTVKRALIILAALVTMWIPEYLWAMDQNFDEAIRSMSPEVYVDVTLSR